MCTSATTLSEMLSMYTLFQSYAVMSIGRSFHTFFILIIAEVEQDNIYVLC